MPLVVAMRQAIKRQLKRPLRPLSLFRDYPLDLALAFGLGSLGSLGL